MTARIFKVFVVIVLLSLPTSGHKSQQHLICKNVESVFSDVRDDSNASHPQAVQGRTGKRGPSGVKGERGLPGVQGPPGRPAVVDYEKIFRKIENESRQALQERNLRFEQLQRNVSDLGAELQRMRMEIATISDKVISQRCKQENGLTYDGKCYTTASVSNSYNLRYNQAPQKCREQGGLVAEIHSKAQQQAIHEFFRSKVPRNAHLWIAMTYQSSGSNLRFRSGKEVSVDQFKWNSAHPSGSHEQVAITFRDGFQHSGEGMFNTPPGDLQGVVCEKTF